MAEVVRVDETGKVIREVQERAVSDTTGFTNVVRGVVVPQMHSLIYLGFLGGLGLLIAAPLVLRRLRRPSVEP